MDAADRAELERIQQWKYLFFHMEGRWASGEVGATTEWVLRGDIQFLLGELHKALHGSTSHTLR